MDEQAIVIGELVRCLADDGSLCWEVGNYVEDGEVVPLDVLFYPIFKKHGLKLRNRMIWHFGHGLHASRRFSGRYETLLWFTKSDNYVFNLDQVRVPAKYPGKTFYKGPNRGKPSGNPLGANPSDVWTFLLQEWEAEMWDIPNVKANHPEKTGHPCQFPVELVERCVLALTNEDDWVFDPYMGVGSTLIAGLMHQRRVIGCDKEAEYVALARQRIDDYWNGRLKVRKMGTPVYVPTGREKVSQIPIAWNQGQ
jgi:adenine-specific DNA-methyltransferase